MEFPYEIYKFLPRNIEYFNSSYFPLPQLIVVKLIEKAKYEKLLKEKNRVIFPSPQLKEKFTPIPKKKKWCMVKKCQEFLRQNSKPNFYQAITHLNFKEYPLSHLIEDFPLIKSFKYLFVGIGNCLIDCLEEIADIDKRQFTLIDIDKDIVNYYRNKGYKAYWGDIRFLYNAIIPESPFDVVVSYHIEYYQTYENISFAYTNLKNWGYLYLAFASAELEDKGDFYAVMETLWHFHFWIIEANWTYIKAIKIEDEEFWNSFFKG